MKVIRLCRSKIKCIDRNFYHGQLSPSGDFAINPLTSKIDQHLVSPYIKH